MHEHHQVEKIVKDMLTLAQQKKLNKVKKVTLALGDLLGFDDTSVKLYFESFTEGTIAENAELVIQHIPGQLKCPQCQKVFTKVKSDLYCPICRTQGVPTEIGKEFSIVNLE